MAPTKPGMTKNLNQRAGPKTDRPDSATNEQKSHDDWPRRKKRRQGRSSSTGAIITIGSGGRDQPGGRVEWIEGLVGKRHIALRTDSGVTVMAREKRDCRDEKMRFRKTERERKARGRYYGTGITGYYWGSGRVIRYGTVMTVHKYASGSSTASAELQAMRRNSIAWISCLSGSLYAYLYAYLYSDSGLHLSQRPHWLLLRGSSH